MLKKVLVVGAALFLLLINAAPAYAQGYTNVNSPDGTIVSVPSKVEKGQSFTVKMKYHNDTSEGYSLSKCQAYSPFVSGKSQSAPLFTFNSGSIKVPSGTVSLSKASDAKTYFVTNTASKAHFAAGETAYLTFNLKASSSELANGDKVYLVFGCSQTADSGASAGLAWMPKTVTIGSTTVATKPKPAPVEKKIEAAPIAKVSMPDQFKVEGSKTTDLSNLNIDTAKEVKDFTLEAPGKGMIKYTEVVDLSGEEVVKDFEKLGEYVALEKGKVVVNSDEIEQLNKKALITFYEVMVGVEEVVIFKDGVDVTDNLIDLKYEDGNLSFEVDGFSEYALSPGLVVDDSDTELTPKNKYTISGSVSDYQSTIEIMVGGQVYEVDNIDESGNFSKEIDLELGENIVTVKATSVSGVEQEETINVTQVTMDGDRQVNWLYLVGYILGALLLLGLLVFGVWMLMKKRKGNESAHDGKNLKDKESKHKEEK